MAPPSSSSPMKKKAASSTPPAAVASPHKKKKSSPSSTSAAGTVTSAVAATASVATAVTPDCKKQPAAAAAAAAASASGRSRSPPVDPDIHLHGANATEYSVVPVEDKNSSGSKFYDAVLNQCNIAGNNNKYYRIQMLQNTTTGTFCVWHKWGRVGETARKSTSKWFGPFSTLEKALPLFSKKYKDKTGNVFGAPNFVTKKNKYVPVEIDNDVQVDDNDDMKAAPAAAAKIEYLPSTLDAKTKELVQVLFSKEMRNEVLESFHLDLNKLPLGVPSQSQIQRGVDILGQIEEKLKNGTGQESSSSSSSSYEELSSRFYTTIPHSFGRNRPPVIATTAALQSRYDMCNILNDMYSTHETMRKIEKDKQQQQETTQVPSPVDEHYSSMHADLTLLSTQSDDYAKIQTYFEKTKGRGHSSSNASASTAKLLNVWSVDRQGEGQRFAKFDALDNRRLLWHGTNIAVVAPILTNGLRIMPHSGGRVGAGIYLACMQEKSAQYTFGYHGGGRGGASSNNNNKFACMFLCEAPLGKSHLIHQDGSHAWSLRAAPDGFDSVHAVGQVGPTTWEESIDLDGKAVQVPQDLPTTKNNQTDVPTSFYHDEFLVYDEAQIRIRYVVTVKLQ